MTPLKRAPIARHITALNRELEYQRQRAETAADLLDSIFKAPDTEAIYAAIERAEDEWGTARKTVR